MSDPSQPTDDRDYWKAEAAACHALIDEQADKIEQMRAAPTDDREITDEMVERMALWLLSYDTRGTLTSFEGRPAHHRTALGDARRALRAALNPSAPDKE